MTKQKKFPKRLFNKTLKLAQSYSETKRTFDKAVVDIYGCHYSDLDDDWIIDAIDYGTGTLDFEDFDRRMREHSKDLRQ